MRDRLRIAGEHPLVAPSILSADFGRMAEECAGVLEQGADILHLDVMDGHFVPNLTMGPDMCRALRRHFPEACLDVHLMVTDPQKFAEAFADAGADHLTFHIEVTDEQRAVQLAKEIRALGCSAGLALNPSTPVERVMDVAAAFDLLLVMSVHPGFSGQTFEREVLAKVRALRAKFDHWIEIDGGVNPKTAVEAREAGCTVLVAASAIFGEPPDRRGRVIREVRGER